jgi:hypothetical protein
VRNLFFLVRSFLFETECSRPFVPTAARKVLPTKVKPRRDDIADVPTGPLRRNFPCLIPSASHLRASGPTQRDSRREHPSAGGCFLLSFECSA